MNNRIGIVGGGQLGRMLGIAAKQLGFIVTVIDPTPDSPAAQVVDHQIVASVIDEQAIRKLAATSDFITFEIEQANAAVLDSLVKEGVTINPSSQTLAVIKNKLSQKQFLHDSRIPTAAYVSVENAQDIESAVRTVGYPFLLKTRLDGYDGRGNVLIRKKSDIAKALEKFKGKLVYIEKFVPFVKELSVIVARSITGEIQTYPVVETIHKNNICHTVIAPAPVSLPIRKKAESLAKKIMQKLKGAGVFGIEMFLTAEGNVLVNEIAPRVHNSGHFTIEACVTSQFEQHIRAISGLPLGKTDMLVPAAVMVNILGDRNGEVEARGLDRVLSIPNVSVHLYGKKETKQERKMGHITVVDKTWQSAYKKATQARKYLHV